MDKRNGQAQGERGEQVYNFLVEYIKENGYAPSIREISAGTSLNSISNVYKHLTALSLMGKIEMKPNSSRAIRLTGYKLVKSDARKG